jgi:hypothetical protein
MKKIYSFFICVFFLIGLFSQITNAQVGSKLSIYYDYSCVFYSPGIISYPFGFGMAYSIPLNNNFSLRSGLGYSFKRSSSEGLRFVESPSNSPNKTIYDSRESSYKLNIGCYYQLTNAANKFSISLGENIVPIYSNGKSKRTKIYDTYQDVLNESNDYFSFGISTGIDLRYDVSQKLSIFLEPQFLYYLFGANVKSIAFVGQSGLLINF